MWHLQTFRCDMGSITSQMLLDICKHTHQFLIKLVWLFFFIRMYFQLAFVYTAERKVGLVTRLPGRGHYREGFTVQRTGKQLLFNQF